MNEPNRTQWQIRCAFNGYCKRTLGNEAINAHRDVKHQQFNEVPFSDLSPQEENQLYTYDTYFEDEEAEKSFCVAGKEITPKLLAEALHSLPEEKREAVLLYYFFDMNDAEIAMQELDATILREFIDRIEVSHTDKKSRTREITIVYNFIGAFDFSRALEEARSLTTKQQRTA